MRAAILGIVLSLVPAWLWAGELQFQAGGGDQLTVKAKANQQKWLVLNERIVVAAVVDGRLVVEDFNWPPGPQPIPPNPEPGPQPQPQPVPGPKTVLWIEESSARTPSQAAAVVDKAIRDALAAARWTLRVVDVDVVDETGKPPADLAGYLDAARQAGVPRVFILQDGRELYAGAAPPDRSSFIALLRRYGLPVGGPAEQSGSPAGSRPQEVSPVKEDATEHEEETQPMLNGTCPTGQCPVPTVPMRRWRLR
ncbi:MAG: hypothetical protein H5U08_03645 [Thermogutta sp.]|uniref:hypothetical protein n=1 Tax=Thermogutta sp. TaxID=1962930 RepID=UPI0019C294B0|nr:hypothetical protein [Thermogutta sp.]MBC7351430.1 hypothetical protein [Thermogutta sp.]